MGIAQRRRRAVHLAGGKLRWECEQHSKARMRPTAVATKRLISKLSSHLQLAPCALLQVVSIHVRTDGHTRRVLPAKQVDGVANSGDGVAGPCLQEGRKLGLGYLCHRLLKRARVGPAPRDRRWRRWQCHPCPDGPIVDRFSTTWGRSCSPSAADGELKPRRDGRTAPDSPEARRRHRAAAPTSSCM